MAHRRRLYLGLVSFFMTFAMIMGAVSLGINNATAEEKSEFTKPTIDLGVVVSDIDKSVEFYTKALGFKQASEFSVPAPFATDAGLTNNQKLDIRVLKLGDGPDATSLKLMQVSGAKSKKSDNRFIHSQLGYSYITIHIADTAAAVRRLKAAGVKTIAKTPVTIPPNTALTLVRDPDGNLIELIGPKSK